MMEFTLSRCALMLCGAIMLATVAAPVSDLFGNELERDYDELAEKIAGTIDCAVGSGADCIIIEGSSLMPDAAYSIEIEGYFVTLVDSDGGTHSASLRYDVGKLGLGYGDTLFVKDGTLSKTP